MVFARLPLTVVLGAVLGSIDSFAMVFAFYPLANIGGVIGKLKSSITMTVALAPFSIVFTAISVNYQAFTIGYSLI